MKAPGDGLLHLLLKVSKVGFIISVIAATDGYSAAIHACTAAHFFERDDQIERYFDLKKAEV